MADGLCCIKGCFNPIRSQLFCDAHYARWEKYGHPLHVPKRYGIENRVYKPKMREKWSWRAMIDRCTKPNRSNFPLYGGRGISVCSRWLESFDNFYADLGPKPNGYSLERLDVNGHYEPINCCWSDITQQNRNTRAVRLNKTLVAIAKAKVNDGATIASIARELKVPYITLYQAVKGTSWKEVDASHGG